tara:strand:+ start:2674 stop:3210 length:537 start_codon:yes stop_codon:yes gene_type:complete
MDIKLLVKVTARAWSLDILALLHKGVPGRQAALLGATGAGRTAFAQSLKHLTELGLLIRNPGHGHPLRPEYVLTEKGRAMAGVASRIRAFDIDKSADALLRRSWTVPVLALSGRPVHYSRIKGGLGQITDRALSRSLKDLQALNWITRDIENASYPPRPLYQAANMGARISRAVGVTP